MESYQVPEPSKRNSLSQEHQHELLTESGISSDVAGERGYYTARSGSEVPEILKGYQRKPGLVIPTFSPDAVTRSCQLKPDNPRKDKKGKPLKYETPGGSRAILDVHLRMLKEVRFGIGDLWITEGIKKADSLTSQGLPTIGLIGVWNFQRDGEMLPCWDHVRLTGRRVFVVFDNDVMVKEGVQLALQRLVSALKRRGADVRVVYLPAGPLKGVDDYLAAGHTVAELKVLARKFEPTDIGNIRLSQDAKLRARVEDLQARWWAEEWKGRGGHSERDVALKLMEAASRSGKAHADGIRVAASWGVLQVGAKVSPRTLSKALARLEERGFLYRDNEGRKRGEAGAFVLRAKVYRYRERAAKETQELRECDPSALPLRAPLEGVPDVARLRWSRPKWKPTKKMIMEYRLRELSWLPEPRERIERLGKIRGAVVDALEVAGGALTLQELCEVLHHGRPRDVRRRVLPMLEDAGIIECEGDVIRLAADWREKLNTARETGGEIKADGLAEANRKRKSRAYHERDKPLVSKPSAAGLEAMRRSRAMRDARLEELARAEEERRKAGPLPKLAALISGLLGKNGRLRMGLLCEMAMEEGFKWRDVPEAARAMGYRVERLPEYGDEEFVFVSTEAAA